MKESTRLLIREIKALRDSGHTEPEIVARLKKTGTSPALIKESYAALADGHAEGQSPHIVHTLFGKVEHQGYQHHHLGHEAQVSGKGPALTLIVLFFVIGLLTLFVIMTTPTSCGEDVSCFLSKAQNCERVSLYHDIKGVSFSFLAADCRVGKKVESLVLYDDVQLSKLLSGKKMECVYTRDHFDIRLLDSLGGDLSACTGQYKNALVALGR